MKFIDLVEVTPVMDDDYKRVEDFYPHLTHTVNTARIHCLIELEHKEIGVYRLMMVDKESYLHGLYVRRPNEKAKEISADLLNS